jgi:signal transduction histidine kinase
MAYQGLWPGAAGLHIDFVQEGMDECFLADVESAAFRIVQETLTNVGMPAVATAMSTSAAADGIPVSSSRTMAPDSTRGAGHPMW